MNYIKSLNNFETKALAEGYSQQEIKEYLKYISRDMPEDEILNLFDLFFKTPTSYEKKEYSDGQYL